MGDPLVRLVDLVDDLFATKDEIKEKEDEAKRLKEKRIAIELQIIEKMETDGLTSFKDGQGRLAFIPEAGVYASIKKENKKVALELLKEWGEGDLIFPNIAPASLNRVIKERLQTDKDVPDELFSYFLKKKVSTRRK